MYDSTTGDHHESYRIPRCQAPSLASQQPTGTPFGRVCRAPGRWRVQPANDKESFLGRCALRQVDDAVRAAGVITGREVGPTVSGRSPVALFVPATGGQ